MAKQGHCFEDLELGMSSAYARTVTQDDIETFAEVSGDDNPLHLDENYAATTLFKGCIAHGMLSAAYISKIMGTQLPGPGAIYVSQSLRFRAPVRAGDTVDTHAEVIALDEKRNRATFACTCKVGDTIVVDGEAQVMVPSRMG
ncbi:MAG: MaoC family dehydratase [Hyphomicrobiales bacterium]